MKKTIVLVMISVLVLSGVAFAANNGYFEGFRIVNINIDGAKVVSDVPAVILNGRTMVPLKIISEELGATVSWNGSTYTVDIQSGSNGSEYVHVEKDYEDGSKYVGSVMNGLRHGFGTFTLPDGTKYRGEYKNDEMHGYGTFTLPNGAQYIGAFKNSMFHGQGTLIMSDGSKYNGEYKNGVMDGFGTYTTLDGSVFSGTWKNNQYIGN